ncbi:MAG: hypothetical protein VX951_06675, partial [Planctomycetota bacterium]|nr:hypothetical protein [Planctomycetota bacterium]
DDALRKKIKEQLFAEMVLSKWQASLDRAMAEHMLASINAATGADIAVEKAKLAKTKADTALEAKPEDAALKKAAETAKTELEAAEKAAETQAKAVDARRGEFNFKAEISKLANGRPGLKFIAVDKMQDAEGLRKLTDVGEWKDSHLPGQMTLAGEIYNGRVQNTKKGSFIFQVSDIEERPFKDFKDLKDDLQDDYITENAGEFVKDKKKLFEETIEKLSRDQLKDEIAKIEKEGKDKIQTEFDEWKKGLDADAAKVEELLKRLGDKNLVAYKKKSAQLDAIKAELAGADDKKKSLGETIDKETEDKIDEKLKEAHKDVLASAGKTAGFKVETLGPLSREVQNLPRFKYRYSNVIQAVFGANAADAEADDVTELEEDSINEVTFMALCSKVDKADSKQISRRQWLTELRGTGVSSESFAGKRMRKAVDLSFTIDALTKGYGWRPPSGLPAEKGMAAGLDKSKDSEKDSKKGDDKETEGKGSGDKPPSKDGDK